MRDVVAADVDGEIGEDAIEDDSLANKWLIFIGYLIGLSIGVHLLNGKTVY